MYKTITITIIICGLGLPNTAWCREAASSAVVSEARAILSFADHLFAEGEYYRAITEYKRLLFLYPQHPQANEVRLQIGDCYLKGEKFDEALEHFQALLPLRLPEEIKPKLLYKIGAVYYAKGEYGSARRQLEQIITRFPHSPEVERAHYLIGQSYLKQDEWIKAAGEFAKIGRGADAEQLSQGARRGRELPYKSPGLAGGFSAVVPGLGQLYVGRKQDALMAFLLNGVFIWGVVESFQRDNDVAGGILLFFETGWYFGNIYSAVSSTHKYNKKLKDDFRDKLNSRFQLQVGSLPGDVGQPFWGLSYRF
jgi:tetratricopeptide (TPR) repeat protein